MQRHDGHSTYDVVVVGARCAGAATAMLLARQGFDVALVDRADLPSDTLSTHALSRGGLVQLARWGLLDDVLESGAPPIRSVSFVVPTGRIDRPIRDWAGIDFTLAPRRHILDAILLRAAEAAGVTVLTGESFTRTVTDRDGRVTGAVLRDRLNRTNVLSSHFLVGADGVRSRVARSVGARTLEERRADASTAYTYVADLDIDGFEFHVGERSFAGVFPTHDGEANVWIGLPGDGARVAAVDRKRGFVALLDGASPSLARRSPQPGSLRRSAPPPTCRTTSSRRPARDGRSSVTPATTVTRSPATASPTRSATQSSSRTERASCCAATFPSRPPSSRTRPSATTLSPRSST